MRWTKELFVIRVNKKPGPTGPYYLRVVKNLVMKLTGEQFLVVEDTCGKQSRDYVDTFAPAPFQPGGLVWWKNPTTLEFIQKKQLRALAADKPDLAKQLEESCVESLGELRKSIRDCGEGPFRIHDVLPFPGGGAVLQVELPDGIAELADDLVVSAETAVVN